MQSHPEFCALHCPVANKPAHVFREELSKRISGGMCNFSHICFPMGHSTDFRGREFPVLADFSQISVPDGGLDLTNCKFRVGLRLSTESLSDLILDGAVISGHVEINVGKLSTQLRLMHANIAGEILIQATSVRTLNLREASIGNITLHSEVNGITFHKASVNGNIRLAGCVITGRLLLDETRFGADSAIFLDNARLLEPLRVEINRDPPRAIHMNGALVLRDLYLTCEIGLRKPLLVAKDDRPKFGAGVFLSNVDLSMCRLVGNTIDGMQFENVKWPYRWGRHLLYDEIAMRRGKGTSPYDRMRETYQILKEKYQRMGNHKAAGDFHYGEMEMKRREYGWPKRILCPEFIYWAFSGYGTGYIRAGAWLVVFAVAFTLLYLFTDPASFSPGYRGGLEALRLSLNTMTLQRPPTPPGFGEPGKWLMLVQSILGPIQLALFALALRMRLKR